MPRLSTGNGGSPAKVSLPYRIVTMAQIQLRMCFNTSSRSRTSAGVPLRPRVRQLGQRVASVVSTRSSSFGSSSTASTWRIQSFHKSPTSPAISPSVKHLEDGDEVGWTLVAVVGTQPRLHAPAGAVVNVVNVYCEDPAFSLASQAAAGRDDFDAARVVLTVGERWAVRAYTSSPHNFINPILRKPADSEAERASLSAHIRDNRPNANVPDAVDGFLLLLQTALAKLPDAKATALTKGNNLDVKDQTEPRYGRNSHPEGGEFAPPDCTSTSQGNPFAERDSLIVYELPPGPGGKPVRTVSDHPTEREVRFGPGMRYRIVRVFERAQDDFDAAAERLGVLPESKVRRIVMVTVLPRVVEQAQ